ncbi:hypothetical protein M8C21_032167 [Ambrosia artemisiifolia]|uniref:Uncharacterized protein n=1 Tax=Ambrosia artemisiifolia TaxID=4212 RepID=A0AAD5CAV3_AMBAR|nr:hypothetical protein M8C21_032167 [Ambrosia artemisiifolia]
MGGKGKKRREKNYKEAHGVGKNRLPPPPLRSSLDVIPSKLRKLMSFTSQQRSGVDTEDNKSPAPAAAAAAKLKLSAKELPPLSSHSNIHQTENLFSTQKKNKKRKRKQAQDLRFVAELAAPVASKRKERKKKLLEERKKKHKKAKKQEDDDVNFPGHEEIKFGEVVQAPPKLLNLPKRFGSSVNASQERIRLRTIEAYRDQKKWASRPGLHLPTTDLAHHNSVVLPVEKQP